MEKEHVCIVHVHIYLYCTYNTNTASQRLAGSMGQYPQCDLANLPPCDLPLRLAWPKRMTRDLLSMRICYRHANDAQSNEVSTWMPSCCTAKRWISRSSNLITHTPIITSTLTFSCGFSRVRVSRWKQLSTRTWIQLLVTMTQNHGTKS